MYNMNLNLVKKKNPEISFGKGNIGSLISTIIPCECLRLRIMHVRVTMKRTRLFMVNNFDVKEFGLSMGANLLQTNRAYINSTNHGKD